jgi:ankyrin repeat protein
VAVIGHYIESGGRTPLHLAALRGNIQAAQLLISHDPSLASCKDLDGNTAIHLAQLHQHEPIMSLLQA